MKNRIEKKLIIGYKSDVLFKWALTRDDEQTEELRKTIIAHITGLPVVKTQVKNPEIHPDQMNQYEMRLDILVQLEDGTYVDIEMQNSRLNEYALAKSEAYLANLHGMQLKGTKPQRFHETHQIVFVNDYPTEPFVMVAHMLIRDLDDHRGGGKMQAHYIYLPYIDDIVKEKGLDGLDKMEAIYYVFQHNDNRDILELAKKYQEVAMLMEKKDAFNNDLDMYMLAAQRLYAYEDFDEYKKIVLEEEIKKATIKAQKTAFDQGLKEGFDQGLKKGFDQGLKDGFNQGQKEGFDQGQKEGFDQGQKEGFDQGQKEGFDQGQKEGFNQGQKAGFEVGRKAALESIKEDQLNAERKESINDIGQMILLLSQKMSEDHRQEEFLNALGNPQRLEILFKEYNL